MRAVADVNVLVSGVLSANGAPAEILRAARSGTFELIASDLLLTELARTLAYARLREHIPAERAAAFISWVRDHATLAKDPTQQPPVRCRDPDDDYLIALAIDQHAYLVTGDRDLLALRDDLPILTPAQFTAKLGPGS